MGAAGLLDRDLPDPGHRGRRRGGGRRPPRFGPHGRGGGSATRSSTDGRPAAAATGAASRPSRPAPPSAGWEAGQAPGGVRGRRRRRRAGLGRSRPWPAAWPSGSPTWSRSCGPSAWWSAAGSPPASSCWPPPAGRGRRSPLVDPAALRDRAGGLVPAVAPSGPPCGRGAQPADPVRVGVDHVDDVAVGGIAGLGALEHAFAGRTGPQLDQERRLGRQVEQLGLARPASRAAIVPVAGSPPPAPRACGAATRRRGPRPGRRAARGSGRVLQRRQDAVGQRTRATRTTWLSRAGRGRRPQSGAARPCPRPAAGSSPGPPAGASPR